MPPSSKTTGLSIGRYFALSDAELKALRATKGDRARRAWVDAFKGDAVSVGDVWLIYKFVAGMDIAFGQHLHRGQFYRIELLDETKVAAGIAKLLAGNVRKSFFAINEKKFNHSNVAFWIADKWKAEGRTTILDDHVFKRYERGLTKLKKFTDKAIAANKHLVFSASY